MTSKYTMCQSSYLAGFSMLRRFNVFFKNC
jgi:hypothetical protein